MPSTGEKKVDIINRWPYMHRPRAFIRAASYVPGGEAAAKRMLTLARKSKRNHGILWKQLTPRCVAVVAWMRRGGRRIYKGCCVTPYVWESSRQLPNLECLIIMDENRSKRYIRMQKKRALVHNMTRAKRLGIKLPDAMEGRNDPVWDWHPTLPVVTLRENLTYSICTRYGYREYYYHCDDPKPPCVADFRTEQEVQLWILSTT